MKKNMSIYAAALAAALLAPSQGTAQTAPSEPVVGAPPEQVVVMSPFEIAVAQDRGYQSTNTASITRLSAAVYDLPVSVQILNAQLIKDFGAKSLYDLGQFFVGGTNQGAATANALQEISLRGMNDVVMDDAQRDGFRIAGPVGLYNVDRVELIRGANSVVQGASDPGGQVNVVTKSAEEGQNFARVSAGAGSYSLTRAALDVNSSQTFGKSIVAVRVNAGMDNTESFTNFAWNNYGGVAVAVKAYLPTRTEFELKIEHLEEDRNPVSAIPDRWSGGPGLTGGYSLGLARAIPQLYTYDEGNAMGGPDQRDRWENYYYVASLTQTFTKDLYFKAEVQSAAEKEQYQVANNLNPALSYNAATNSEYVRNTWGWYDATQTRYNLRAYVNYNMDLGFTEQKFIVGGSLLHLDLKSTNDLLWDSASGAQVAYNTVLGPGQITAQNYSIPYASTWYWRAQTPTGDHVNNPSFYANSTGSYWGGRIQTVLGWSYNVSTRTDYVFAAPTGGSFRGSTQSMPAITAGMTARYVADTPMAAILYKINREWHLFFDYSKSYKPQTAYLPTMDINTGVIGATLAPNIGTGYEGGIKYSLLNDTLSGSLCAYSIQETNIAQVIDTNTVAHFLGQNVTQRYYTAGQNLASKGVEFEVFYNPNPHWTLAANYAYNEAWISASPAIPIYVGISANDHSKHLAHAQTRYSFTDGALKGWFVGGDTQYRSQQFGYQGVEYFFAPAFEIFGVFAGYAGKVGNCHYSIQANANNVLDKKYFFSYALLGTPANYGVSADLSF